MQIKEILETITKKRILVIGDLMLDKYIMGDASRLSPEAPVPVVRIQKETAVAGGAANVAINLATLGAEVSLFGWVGDDSDGARLLEILSASGVTLLPCAFSKVHKTIVKTRVLCRRQQLCRLDQEEAPEAYSLTVEALEAVGRAAANADAILLSDYAKGILTSSSLREILSLPALQSKLITLDPKPRPGIDYTGLSLMTPNRSEALRLAGLEETHGEFPADAVCKAIYEKFAPEHLVVTLGPDGMLLSEKGMPGESIPTFAQEVFDVSGAGDTVIAALTLARAAGFSLPDAARFANVAAGVVVGKLGTATATPEEILSYAKQIHQ